MQSIDFEGEVGRIVQKDPRYNPEAYFIVRRALDFCQEMSGKSKRKARVVEKSEDTHVSVARLLDGIRQVALEEYGPMAMLVLNSWGVKSCDDFGEIVFVLVEHQLFKVTEQDTREEFKKGYDFFEAFRAPFKPGKGSVKDQPAKEPSAT